MSTRIAVVLLCLVVSPLFAKPLNIAMVLWRGETQAEQGFLDALKIHGYSPNINLFNAERDRVRLLSHVKNRIKPKLYDYHYIYTFGTTASVITQQVIRGRRPQIFNVVSDPKQAGLLRKKNIAGVSNQVDMLQLFGQALQLYPSPKVGMIYNPQERNSVAQLKSARAATSKLGVQLVPVKIAPSDKQVIPSIKRILLSLRNKKITDVFLPFDSFLIEHGEILLLSLNREGIFSFTSSEALYEQGADLGLLSDYYKLGLLAADIVHEHQQGMKLENIAVKYQPKLKRMLR